MLFSQPLTGLGEYRLETLIGGGAPRNETVAESALAALNITVPADRTPGGGLAVLLVAPTSAVPS